jgi:hypothetical protein
VSGHDGDRDWERARRLADIGGERVRSFDVDAGAKHRMAMSTSSSMRLRISWPPVSFIVTVLGPAGETTASRTAASFTEARHAEQAGRGLGSSEKLAMEFLMDSRP